jgi:curli production assembly/transport component CsgF
MRNIGLLLIAIVTSSAMVGPAVASEIVYHPVNPSFGGNPLNGSSLLSAAQAQGQGVKSGSQGPDLSGLDSALSNIGSGAVIIGGSGTGGSGSPGSGGGSGSGSGSQSNNAALRSNSNAVRAIVP